MIQMPKPGQHVDVHDPLGYSGRGTITAVMVNPHHAVLVRMETITDRVDQSTVGKEIWVLTGHVEPVKE